MGLAATQYGALAGLTVYAVPQVLAATAPYGSISMQAGTLVKLLRVLMLGPLVVLLSFGVGRHRNKTDAGAAADSRRKTRFVPWFITGFLVAAAVNTAGLVPYSALTALRSVAVLLTAVAMAALGLGVDVRTLGNTGLRVAVATTASLLMLTGISLAVVLYVLAA